MLDRIDRAILGHLARDARMSNKDLARDVGLSQSACLERVRRLADQKTLRGAHADVDPRALGIEVQALVAVQLKQHTRKAVARFEAKAWALPQVVTMYHTTGRNDYIAHVVAQDMDHLRDFTLDALNALPEVARIDTSLVFKDFNKHGWPDLTEEE